MSDKHSCPNCGQENINLDKLCSKCGYKFEESVLKKSRYDHKTRLIIYIIFGVILTGLLGGAFVGLMQAIWTDEWGLFIGCMTGMAGGILFLVVLAITEHRSKEVIWQEIVNKPSVSQQSMKDLSSLPEVELETKKKKSIRNVIIFLVSGIIFLVASIVLYIIPTIPIYLRVMGI